MKKENIAPLTGLRGLAAYSVLIAHCISASFMYGGPPNEFQPFAGRLAYFGMSLFFVLSGFVIHYNYARTIKMGNLVQSVYRFMTARIARLYPLYALVIVFSLSGLESNQFDDNSPAIWAYATMTQSWFNLQDVTFAPTWSISTEFFFYTFFLVLLPVAFLVRRPLVTLAVFCLVAFLALPSALPWIYTNLAPDSWGWVIYYSPYIRVLEFICGVLASLAFVEVKKNVPSQRISNLITIGLLSTVAILLFANPFGGTQFGVLRSNFMYAPSIAFLLVIICCNNTWFSALLSSKPFLFAGEISYSVYLLQFWIITALGPSFTALEPSAYAYVGSIFKVIAIVTLTTFVGYGSFTVFEGPSRIMLRNMFRRIEDIFSRALRHTPG